MKNNQINEIDKLYIIRAINHMEEQCVMEERTHDERVLAICGAYLELAEKKREKFLKMLQKEGFITESEFCDLLKESEGIQE